jgi:hypothetical protein
VTDAAFADVERAVIVMAIKIISFFILPLFLLVCLALAYRLGSDFNDGGKQIFRNSVPTDPDFRCDPTIPFKLFSSELWSLLISVLFSEVNRVFRRTSDHLPPAWFDDAWFVCAAVGFGPWQDVEVRNVSIGDLIRCGRDMPF